MIRPEVRDRVRKLHHKGVGIKKIARNLRISRNSVRDILREPEKPAGERNSTSSPSLLDPYRSQIQELLERAEREKWKLTTKRILKEIRKRGYGGGRTLVDDYVRNLRGPRRKVRDVHPRFETQPAEEAQQDWSPYRVKIAAKLVLIQLFSLILAWSRYQFMRGFLDQKFSSLLYGHVGAFHYFQGIPWSMVYDRQRTITPFDIDGKPILTEKFEQFADHYGFEVVLCLPGGKERKGKIEKPFQFFESSFLPLRTFESLEDFNAQLLNWLDGVEDPEEGNHRKHGTTNEVPYQRWLEEKQYLYELPATDLLPRRIEKRLVWKDATISVDGTRYTVPASLAERRDREVWVSIGSDDLLVYDDKGAVVARHALRREKGGIVIDESHYAEIKKRRDRRRVPELDRRFLECFAGCEDFLNAMKETLSSIAPIHLREILGLARRYRLEEVREALRTALAHGTPTAGYVRKILSRTHPTGHMGNLGNEPPKGLSLGPIDPGNPEGYNAIFGNDQQEGSQCDE
jgi:transposase